MIKLTKEIENIFRQYAVDIIFITENCDEHGLYTVELETSSFLSEVSFSLQFDGTIEDFIQVFSNYADTKVDVDDEYIRTKFWDIEQELHELQKKEMKWYKCSINITDGEDTESQVFYIRAKSCKEGMNNIVDILECSS